MKPRGVLLNEGDARTRELERIVKADPNDEQARARLKGHRIRTGEARRFTEVVAEVGLTGYPRWRLEWVHIGRWEDHFDLSEHGRDPDDYGRLAAPWVIALGAGFSVITFMVEATHEHEAVEAAEEAWPNEFWSAESGNSHPDAPEYDDSVEIRVLSKCRTWEVARSVGGGKYELLDGRVVETVP